MTMFNITRESIETAIAGYEIDQESRFARLFRSNHSEKLRPSAVLMPLLKHNDEWHILLTHRSQNLVEHRGQVAFPGGARESGDEDLQVTALREMHEEIGIMPDDVVVFGHLGDMPIVTGYLIRPYVGEIPWPYPLKLSAEEVESVFTVPLKWLIDPNHRSVRYRSFAGREFPVIYFDCFDGHQLWGASAEMMVVLLSALNLIA